MSGADMSQECMNPDRWRRQMPAQHEPRRFGMTGLHCGAGLRLDCGYNAALGYALDAPEYVARGSLKGHEQSYAGSEPFVYVCATDLRPGVLL